MEVALTARAQQPRYRDFHEACMTEFREKMQRARALYDDAERRIDKLRNIEPYLIDLSLRENPVGARVGQTLADKLAILPKVREFGFKNILLGTLDYDTRHGA